MEIFIKTAMGLDEVATILSKALNVAPENQTPYQRQQRRFSENYGGDYYLLEVFGTTIILVRNIGQVEIPERSGWPYYAIVNCKHATKSFLHDISEHLARLLSSDQDLKVEVDDLSA
jgi:hypothetical protein